ncbi:hypothetical protein MNBD_GAMMA15-1229 [hydrothermal vent metagenome]|uniref:DUF4124 domain-containing protein n=1 Tax=hydrothermal vent metagenome TaxID=652676 RepID=A0A3B0ZF40_9ZZZZ
MITRTLIAALLLLATAGAHATMYKWKDAQGNTQFGQFPPAGVESQRMKAPRAPATTPDKGPSLQDRVKAMENRQGKANDKALAEKQKKERAAQLKQNCDNARSSSQLLQRGGNRLYKMPDGSYKRFNAEESKSRIDKSKKFIAENCS